MMKTDMMRAPLIKSAVVLVIFALLAYLTSASPESGVLGSIGQIIIGAFRLVQWAVAMVIGLAVCIAFLIGIFLFAASLVDQSTAASMFVSVKDSVAELCSPLFAAFNALRGKEAPTSSAGSSVTAIIDDLKDELQVVISDEVQKVTDNQQVLMDQFATLTNKMKELEAKTADFAASTQLEAIADEIAASGQALNEVKDQVVVLKGALNDTVDNLQELSPDKILGDLPTRLEKLEQKDDGFDPQPLTEAIEALKTEVEEVKKKKTTTTRARSTAKPKKKS